MKKNNLFHQGELYIQKLTGEQDTASRLSKLIDSSIPTRALDFICQQSVIWIGIERRNNLLSAFPIFGSPGFINPNKEKQVEINLEENFLIPDEWRIALQKGKSIACLVIDLSTRNRIRINGIIQGISKNKLLIDIQQAYPNCPKYIRKRKIQDLPIFSEFTFKSSGIELTKQTKSIINCSDTAFVASLAPEGADVSHRGGASGFIKCFNDTKVIVPDYKGNNMFNTLGNFKANPYGGITIVDFTQGYYLQLSGKINLIINNQKSPLLDTGGTKRFWELEIQRWSLFQLTSNLKWSDLDFSPYNP